MDNLSFVFTFPCSLDICVITDNSSKMFLYVSLDLHPNIQFDSIVYTQNCSLTHIWSEYGARDAESLEYLRQKNL